MPNTHSANRQLRKSRQRARRNVEFRSALKTLKKNMVGLLAQQKQEEARTLLPIVMRRFDQAAAKGLIHKNTASRTKSRLMQALVRGLPARPQPTTKRADSPDAPASESTRPPTGRVHTAPLPGSQGPPEAPEPRQS